jgi:3-methyladenine DNA glycosylase AlkD
MKGVSSSLSATEWFKLIVNNFSMKSNPVNAAEMSKYMRDKFQFLGIQKPIRSELQKELLRLNGIPAITVLEELVGLLWEAPEREFQYAAIDLMNLHARKLPMSFIKIIELIHKI